MRSGLITVVFAIVLVHTQFGAMTGAMDGGHTTPTPAVFLPLIIAPETTHATPTPIPTATPVLPPPSFTSCSNDPGSAINYPVRIVTVFKRANPETARLQNVSAFPVDLTGWRMCSIRGGQQHLGMSGMLAPGEIRDFPYTGSGSIWNDNERDPGALYDAEGRLISYWPDP
jgi:micrococcal nuclease